MNNINEPKWCDHVYEISGREGTGYSIVNLYTCFKCGYTKRDDSKERT